MSIQTIDKIVRVFALASLVPYSYVTLLLASFATDDPNSGMFGFFLVIALMLIPFILISISTIRPYKISKNVYIGSIFSYLTIIGAPILFYALIMQGQHMIGNFIYLIVLITFIIAYFLIDRFFKLNP